MHKHHLIPSTYHQCVKERLNDRMIRIAANSFPFETMFYDEWASFGESLVSKPQGTFFPPNGRTFRTTQSLI